MTFKDKWFQLGRAPGQTLQIQNMTVMSDTLLHLNPDSSVGTATNDRWSYSEGLWLQPAHASIRRNNGWQSHLWAADLACSRYPPRMSLLIDCWAHHFSLRSYWLSNSLATYPSLNSCSCPLLPVLVIIQALFPLPISLTLEASRFVGPNRTPDSCKRISPALTS